MPGASLGYLCLGPGGLCLGGPLPVPGVLGEPVPCGALSGEGGGLGLGAWPLP